MSPARRAHPWIARAGRAEPDIDARRAGRRRGAIAALAGALLLSSALLHAQATRPAASRATDPHWRHACAACHPIEGGRPQRISFADAEQRCLSCHDGVRASAEAHPVGRLLQGDRFLDPGWPLLDGRLACLTCHDIGLTTGHPRAQRTESNFLRPGLGQGPYAFCASCHKPVQFSRVNPHRMMTPEEQVVPADCLLCHKLPPDPKAMVRTGKWDLRATVMVLCRSCHYYHVDWFRPGHMGAKVPPKMLAYMRAREIIGPTSRPSRQMIQDLQSEGARPQEWPLGPDDTVICTTCHNPHQKGVFPPDSALGHDAMVIRGDRVVSRIEVPQLCLRCHNV